MRRTEQLQGNEVRGGLRAELSWRAEPGRGVGDSGGLGADLPALAGAIRPRGRRFVRPAPGPGFGAARRGRRGAGRAERCSILGFSRPSTSGRSWLDEHGFGSRAACTDLAGARARSSRRRGAGRTDVSGRAGRWRACCAPGRLQPRAWWSPLDDALLGLFRRGGRHEHVSKIAAGPVSARSKGGALLAHAEGRRQGRQGQSDPGGPGASAAAGDRADRGLFASRRGGARSACSGPCRSACPRSCAWPGSPPCANRYLKEVFWPAHNAALCPAG